jgi:hypothetical protein
VSTTSEQYWFVSDWVDEPPAAGPVTVDLQRRALLIWPGLDRDRLRRTQGDPWKIARLVARRTSLSLEAILTLLLGVQAAGNSWATGHAPPSAA